MPSVRLIRAAQLATPTWWCTIVGSGSIATMHAARSARVTEKPHAVPGFTPRQ
jgi:hypothetical protein